VAILASLEGRAAQLPGAQKDYLRYLKAWKAATEDDDQTAIPELTQITQHSSDLTLQFRARSTLMNLQEVRGITRPPIRN